MALPGTTDRVVQDLYADVIDALQGRTDVSAVMAARYVRRAIQEITASNPFEELRVTGPQVTLTTGVSTYLASMFVNNGDDFTLLETFSIYVDYPNNQTVDELRYKTPKAISQMTAPVTTGTPGWFTRFGVNIQVGPTPDNPYTVWVKYQLRHPFPEDVNALPGAALYIPADWEDIIVYSAAERICVVKRWNEQAKYLHELLYGDPESMTPGGKMGRPGLIAAKLMQVERDQMFNNRSLSVVVPRYTAR
jgi:hypothetical protein